MMKPLKEEFDYMEMESWCVSFTKPRKGGENSVGAEIFPFGYQVKLCLKEIFFILI